MKLIKTLTNQLKGTLDLQSKYGDTSFRLQFSLDKKP